MARESVGKECHKENGPCIRGSAYSTVRSVLSNRGKKYSEGYIHNLFHLASLFSKLKENKTAEPCHGLRHPLVFFPTTLRSLFVNCLHFQRNLCQIRALATVSRDEAASLLKEAKQQRWSM